MNQNFIDELDIKILKLLQNNAKLSNVELAARVSTSPATTLRRVELLQQRALIERYVAHLNPDVVSAHVTPLLHAWVQITLDRQDQSSLAAFESRCLKEPCVQQCWRVSSGSDFVLLLCTPDMPAYLALAERLFTQDALVRNVRPQFCTQRSKFGTELPLP